MRNIKYIFFFFAIICSFAINAQTSQLKKELFEAHIQRDGKKWEKLTLNFEKQANLSNTNELIQLIHCYYGWTSILIHNKQKDAVAKNIRKVNNWIDVLLKQNPKNAIAINYKAVFIGYDMNINKAKIPFSSVKCLNLLKEAYKLSPNNPQILFDNGNSYFYAPKAFGGSKTKALEYFQKSISIIEQQNDTDYNWLYLQMIALSGVCYEDNNDYTNAKKQYEKALKIAPNFLYVRNELYPNLLKKIK